MLHHRLKILSSLTAFLISGCTQVGLGVANLPANFSDIVVERDIAYGAEEWQKLDLYIPPVANEKEVPVVVFFYGGRWTDGSKDMYGFVGEAFAAQGYAVAIPDYSKYPQVKFPDFVHDGAQAVAWVHKNKNRFNGGDDLFISGHSSGAHIGSLVLADEKYLAAHDLKPDIITAFAGLAGPYDFVPEAEDLKDMFGPPEKYPEMRATSFISGDEPPMLLLWGQQDQAVWARNHKLLSEKINEKQGDVTVKEYEGLNHVEIIGSLTWFWRSKAPVLQDVLTFFEKHKSKGKTP